MANLFSPGVAGGDVFGVGDFPKNHPENRVKVGIC